MTTAVDRIAIETAIGTAAAAAAAAAACTSASYANSAPCHSLLTQHARCTIQGPLVRSLTPCWLALKGHLNKSHHRFRVPRFSDKPICTLPVALALGALGSAKSTPCACISDMRRNSSTQLLSNLSTKGSLFWVVTILPGNRPNEKGQRCH